MTKLRKLLDTKLYSVKTVAEFAKRTPFTIIKYARGELRPGFDPAQAIADLYQVSPKWLWCDGNIDDWEQEKEYVKKDVFNRMQNL